MRHLNEDVEKMVVQLRDLGALKAAGEQQAQQHTEELTQRLANLTAERGSLQQQLTSVQQTLARQQEVNYAKDSPLCPCKLCTYTVKLADMGQPHKQPKARLMSLPSLNTQACLMRVMQCP